MTMGNGSLDLATFINTAMDRGGRSGGGSGWGDGEGGFLWILLVLLLGGGAWGNGWGGGGRGGATGGAAESVDRAVAQARADGLSDQVVIDAIRGNGTAISQLASTLNCSVSAIQNAICGIDKSILQVSNQVGMSSMEIINAVQAGNCQLTSQIAQCCCDMKQLVTTMSFENRIQNMEQTNALTGAMNAGFNLLGNKIDAQTQTMLNSFQGIKDYLTSEKIESLQHTVTQMENAASNANQTLAFRAAVDAATTPIYNQVNALIRRVPPAPVPAYPAPQYATGYAFGVIPTTNCNATWTNNCGCGCGGFGA